ncbi:MAG TPA: adenylate/guanylate cyclase domain-containing protein [Burkholderiaceae bacterium]|jgi:class 3 adenylate cyclase/tetratricopeptide (TPR) repeat protein
MTDLSDGAPASSGKGQRRRLTIVFADLSGSTRLAEAMEAEHYALMLAQLRQCYQSAINAHGGQVVRIQGDGLLAIFGHPNPREDEARHACEAALAMHEAVRQLRPQGAPAWAKALTLHSGIHAGLVLMDEGDEVRGRFELLGQAPSIAARLSELAGPDQILVSAETLGLQQHFFLTSESRELVIRGRTDLLSAYGVLGRAAVARRFDASVQRGLAPFIGRKPELEQLHILLAETRSGRSRWVNLRAAAGVGKTRLCEQFLQEAADTGPVRVLRGYCSNDLSAEPLQPFMQMLRSLPATPEVLGTLNSPPHRRGDAVLALIDANAQHTPLLLSIDDLQWADDASLALAHRLNTHALQQSLRLLLVSTSRPQTQGDTLPAAGGGAAQMVELRPFSDDEASAAVTQLLPRTDPFIAAEIQRHAGGNALFIEELCHAMSGQPGQGVQQPAGSAWLGALIESRMARLPVEQIVVLRAAAAIGNVIPVWLLERLTGRGAEDPTVLALAEQDFIFPGQGNDELRFKHGVTHEVVYQSIGLHERQGLHRLIAAVLRERAQAGGPLASHELLAYHDGAAGDWQRAADHAEAAGDQALAVVSLDRAKKQFRAALVALEYLADDEARRLRWISIAQRFGLACVFDASRADLRVLQHAAELAREQPDVALRARADYWLGYVSYALGEARLGLTGCERGLAAAEDTEDAALRAQLRGALGQIHAAAADYVAAEQLLDEAIAIQTAQVRQHGRRPSRPPVGLAYSLACRATVAGDRGQFAQSQALFEESLQDILGTGHAVEASVLGLQAAVLLWQGRWSDAQASASEAHRIGARVRSLFTFSMGRAAGAYGSWMERGDPGSLMALQEATGWLAQRGCGLFSSLNHGWLADVLSAQGQHRRARAHVAQALRRGRQHDWIGVAMAYRAAARMAPDTVEAQRYLERSRRVARHRGAAHEIAATDLAAAELLNDQAALDAAEAAFERLAMPWHLAQAQRLRLKVAS